MTVAGTQVETVNSTAETARNGLHAVTDQGEKIHHLADHIATSTRQQATAGNEIALRMEDIVSGIDQTSNTIQEVTVRSKQIQQATECLRDLIAYFRFIR